MPLHEHHEKVTGVPERQTIGVGAKELLWLPIGDQERLVSDLLCLSKKVGRV